jgi:hypothetical protein
VVIAMLDALEQELCEDGADREVWNPKAYCEEEEEERRDREDAGRDQEWDYWWRRSQATDNT